MHLPMLHKLLPIGNFTFLYLGGDKNASRVEQRSRGCRVSSPPRAALESIATRCPLISVGFKAISRRKYLGPLVVPMLFVRRTSPIPAAVNLVIIGIVKAEVV